MNTNMEELAQVWRNIDDLRTKLKREFEAKDQELEEKQDTVGGVLNAAMAEMGADSIKTTSGTIERKPQYKPSAADWGAVYRFVVENDAFDLLHKRLSSTFVEKYAEENDGALPPGINVYTEFKVKVRKPSNKTLPKGDDNE